MDTIFALASGPGKAGVSVIRVSGPRAFEAGKALVGSLPSPRLSSVRKLSYLGEYLDEALVITFEPGKSFTGEAVVEFQVHGSIAVVSAVLEALSKMPGLRMAEAGEFTRRALENGRLDLTQVEALSDLIDAETEAQRKQALEILSGAIAERVGVWRTDIIRAAALLEATIDFADEDVPVDVTDEVRGLLSRVIETIQAELDGLKSAERIRVGFEIAIVGPPNAGKSTLLNYLAGREAAITSEVAGTTRDVIEVRMDIGGLAVTLLDTAGLRETEDAVEAIGVSRAEERAGKADVRVHLVPLGEAPILSVAEGDVVLSAKQDAGIEGGISGKTGHGVAGLLRQLESELLARSARASVSNRERHRNALAQARANLTDALMLLENGPDTYDLVAEEIRSAARRLESLLGHVDVEHLLGEIFSSFCVGK